jgi:hypothetical protein
MDKFKILYYGLLFLCFLLSFMANRKADKSMIIFPFLLFTSIMAELSVYLIHAHKGNYSLVYHIYVPLEYLLFAYYFYLNNRSQLAKKLILYSMPVYLVASITYSIIASVHIHPGFQINLEGFFLILWAILSLFSLEAKEGNKINALPIFWICVAVLIYHSGIFTYTGIYNYIIEQKSSLGAKLNLYILQISNYILYICLSIAFICSHQTKR